MTIEYRLITAHDLENAGVEELFQSHWDEVPLINQQDIGVELDWERYNAFEKEGHLVIIAAYDGKRPVGYLLIIADTMQQHKGLWLAQTDAIYVHPDYRDRHVGVNLLKQAEQHLEKCGVHFFQIMVNMTHDFSKLPESMGYDHAYKVYNKRIK